MIWTALETKHNVSITSKTIVGHGGVSDYVIEVCKGRITRCAAIPMAVLQRAESAFAPQLIMNVVDQLVQEVGYLDSQLADDPKDAALHLWLARTSLLDLIMSAEKRGDVAGADAWRIAIEAVELAQKTFNEQRDRQTWDVAK